LEETTVRLRKYEAMIILDSAKAGTDWDGVMGRVRELMEREGAEIERLGKWDERRLAYEVKGQRRGTYVLACFSAPTGSITVMRRMFELSEDVLKALILRPESRKKKRFKVRKMGEQRVAAVKEGVGESSEGAVVGKDEIEGEG
jgi:ribosomal protein S6